MQRKVHGRRAREDVGQCRAGGRGDRASVNRNWAREINYGATSSPETHADTGYSVVINCDILGRHIDAPLEHDWAGIGFDEAHYVKNHTSQRSRLGRRLVERKGHDPAIVALTGTPLTNRPRDLFALPQLVRHPMAKSFLSFAKRYCAAHHNGLASR